MTAAGPLVAGLKGHAGWPCCWPSSLRTASFLAVSSPVAFLTLGGTCSSLSSGGVSAARLGPQDRPPRHAGQPRAVRPAPRRAWPWSRAAEGPALVQFVPQAAPHPVVGGRAEPGAPRQGWDAAAARPAALKPVSPAPRSVASRCQGERWGPRVPSCVLHGAALVAAGPCSTWWPGSRVGWPGREPDTPVWPRAVGFMVTRGHH